MRYDFSEFPDLETDRLVLRQITDQDADAIFALYSDPAVLQFLSIPPVKTIDEARDTISFFHDLFQQKEAIQWGIRADDVLIGICDAHTFDYDNRKMDIGFTLLPSVWGRGYATEATLAIIKWSFEAFDLHRIQADCTDGNIGSERVLLKCGFTLEGIWRESEIEYGRFVNIKQFGLLRREFDMLS
ncbi:MAG: GNAT family N-acetyltransferase [Chloroflexota bacterium]